MPIGGENVGTAFVRIIASGEGLDKSIREQFDDSSDAWEDSARRNTQTYVNAWQEEMKKGPNQKKLTDGIRNTLLKADFLQSSFFRDKAWSRFKAGMANQFGEAGQLAVVRLEEQLLRGEISLERLGDRVQNMLGDIAKAHKELYEEGLRTEREVTKERERLLNGLRDTYEKVIHDTKRLEDGEKTLFATKKDLIAAFRDYRSAMEEAGAATEEWEVDMSNLHRRLRVLTPRINQTTTRIGRLADGIGRAFGRGSRNDFLNFFGSMVRGMVNLISLIPRLIGFFIQLGQSIKYAFDETMRNTGSTFRAVMAAVIATLETAGAAAAVMAAGFAVLLLVIGPLVSIMLALAGALSAVVGSLTFALSGGIVALAGAIVPLVAGIGVAVAAFKSMDKAQKEALKNDFRPVVDQFKRLGDIAATELFKDMAGEAQVLKQVLESTEPIVAGVARAIRGVFDEFVNGLQSPFFFQFMQSLNSFLPNAVAKLGEAFNNFFFGFLGFFQAAEPLINRFLTWLVSISDQFRDWATSKQGRDEIRDFLQKAGDSAAALGQFAADAWFFLNQLFTAGQDTGDSLIMTLGDKLREWGQFIKENPDAVGKFFEDAEKTAGQIGRIIEEVGRLIDILDSERTRKIGGTILRSIEVGIKGIGGAAAASYTPLFLLIGVFHQIKRAAETVAAFMRGGFPNSMGEARTAARNATDAIAGFFKALPGKIIAALSGVGEDIRRKFYEGLDDIAKIPGLIVGYFQGLGTRISQAIGSINIDWPSPPSWMSKYLGGGFDFPLAAGGVVYGPTRALIGEAGAEAVVPLNRPLSQVDPAVRWLSAIAQGKGLPMASGGVAAPGKTISADGWTVVSNAEDPRAVAAEVVNRLVAVGY